MSDDDADEAVLLEVNIPWTKDFISILKGLAFRDFCSLKFFTNGMRLTVDDEIEVQGNPYFKIEFFNEYKLNAPEVSICVKAKVLLQAMSMFQDPSATTRIIYRAYGEPLEIQMEAGTIKAQVKVPTHEVVDLLNIQCDATALPVKILFTPSFLRDLLADIDQNCRNVKFEFFKDKIQIETKGEVYQHTEVHVCDENAEDFLVINSVDGGVIVCFRSEHIRRVLTILKSAKRAALRIDSNGVLCIQLMIEHEEEMITYFDFLLYSSMMDDSVVSDQQSQPNPVPNASQRAVDNPEQVVGNNDRQANNEQQNVVPVFLNDENEQNSFSSLFSDNN